MSDRIAVMNQGRVLQVGTPVEIYERPATRFVADFIGETNFLEGRLVAFEEGYARVEVEGFPLLAARPDGISPGQSVTVAIRPERIHVSLEEPLAFPNRYPGRIEEMIYIGTDTLFRIRLNERLALRARMQNREGIAPLAGYAPGSAIWVAWIPESARVLRE